LWFKQRLKIYDSDGMLPEFKYLKMMILKYRTFLLISAAILVAGCAPFARQKQSTAEQLPSDSLLYHAMAAEIAGHSGLLEDSIRHYRKVIRETDQVIVIRRAVRIMLFAKDYKAADEAMTKWLSLMPDNMEAHQIAVTIELNQDNIAAASEHLEWILQRSGKQGYRVVVALLERMDEPDKALIAMESMLSRHSENAYMHAAYARMAFNLKQFEKARTAASRAIELQAENIHAHIFLARSRIELGEVEQALTDLEKVVEQSPEDRELRLSYARLLVSSNRFESAVSQFEVLITQAPDNADLLYSTALVMMQIKRYSQAEKHFRTLISLNAHIQEARYYLGRLEEDRKNFQVALDWYGQVDEGPLYIDSRINAARALAKLGEVDRARESYRTIREDHQDVAARVWLSESETLRELKLDQAAYDVLDKAVKLMPDDMDLLYSRALAAERIDRIDILERDLKVVLKNKPDHAHALNALGYTLADRTDRYAEALEYIKRAFKLEPTDPAIIDSMGWIQYRLGNLEKALEYLQRAIAAFHDSEIAAHLGEVLWVSGNQKAAEEVWEKALAEYPDSEILINVIRRFKP